MKFYAVNKYNLADTCGHMHRSENAAQKCCDKIFSFNVGAVKAIYSAEESDAGLELIKKWNIDDMRQEETP